jgi:hypothetical protein
VNHKFKKKSPLINLFFIFDFAFFFCQQRAKKDNSLDVEYVWKSYKDSECQLQERAGALDELNRSIANKEAAVEKLATEEDWLREVRATTVLVKTIIFC